MNISISMYSLNATVQKEYWTTVDFIEYPPSVRIEEALAGIVGIKASNMFAVGVGKMLHNAD